MTPDGTHADTAMNRSEASTAESNLRTFSDQEVGIRPHLDCTCDMRAIAITPDGSRVLVSGGANGISAVSPAEYSLSVAFKPAGTVSSWASSPR